ncbi:MAG: fatty acid desaturase [Herminiimonas sp.]|nr:fatty acid desaturase [Herminiimonas sp.]
MPPDAPLPHRKVIRSWTTPLSSRSTWRALLLSAFDLGLLTFALAAAAWLQAPLAKLVCGLVAGLVIGRLFILGHDACHQSFTVHRRLNSWLGRLLFLPSLTPYSLWSVGHNVVHHGYTNLKDFDFVWQPLSLQEFDALSPWRQRLERIYRSGWAPGLYYVIEMWWKRMYFPSKKQMPTRRASFVWDGLLVTGAAVLWLGAMLWIAGATGQSLPLQALTTFVVPLVSWMTLIGFVVYVHHTHVDVAWYQDKAAWAAAQPFVTTTVHLKFGCGFGSVLHHIMEHTAHHVDMSVPLYRLKGVQQLLEDKLPGHIVIQKFSLGWYRETARRCKLYDYERRCWTDYSGQPTSASLVAPDAGEALTCRA